MTQAPRLTEAREKEIREAVSCWGHIPGPKKIAEALLADLDAVRAERDKYHDDWFSAAKRECEFESKLASTQKALIAEQGMREQLIEVIELCHDEFIERYNKGLKDYHIKFAISECDKALAAVSAQLEALGVKV